jgi:hypothetical protein
MLRLDGIYTIITNVATRREDLHRKYFIFSFTLYFKVNYKIQVHVLTNQLHLMESFVRQ